MLGPELFLVVVPLIVGVRFVADRMDRMRIRDDVGERGGVVEGITWHPFGRGWFGEKSDRIYEVAWIDSEHESHVSWCKTSLFTGVYWSEDRFPSRRGREVAALQAENRRLREELERARQAGR